MNNKKEVGMKIFFVRGSFSDSNPIAILAFFICIIGISMFSLNPVILIGSSVLALCNLYYLAGAKGVWKTLRLLLPIAVLTMLLNPLFNHRGRTVLGKFPNGSNLTLEAVIYGAAAALILISVCSWFACFNRIMDSDKILYIFGNVSPALALLISMCLRFVPEFAAKSAEIRNALKGSCPVEEKTLRQKIYFGMEVTSALISWSVENAAAKAKNIRSRAYGTGKRTAYSLYKWTLKDTCFTITVLVCFAVYISGWGKGVLKYWYFPVLYGELFTIQALRVYAFGVLLSLLPIVFDFAPGIRRTV